MPYSTLVLFPCTVYIEDLSYVKGDLSFNSNKNQGRKITHQFIE